MQPIIVVFTDGRLTHYEYEGVQEDKSIQIPDDSVCLTKWHMLHLYHRVYHCKDFYTKI